LVVGEAIRTSQQTGGAFDATVGPLVNLWHFGPERNGGSVPSDSQIAENRERVGYQRVQARLDPPALKKSRPDVEVDLSAIAKGFGVDKVAEYLDRRGAEGYMVEIGGEVRTRGRRGDGSPWKIGVVKPADDPAGGQSLVQRVLPLGDDALATSGDYRNFFEQDGTRYSHTIDPRTGRPVEHQLASVTVVGPTCMQCDALATALMVLGPEAGYNLAVDRALAVLFVVRDGDRFSERATPVFQQRFPEQPTMSLTLFLAAVAVFAVAMAAMAVGVIFGRRRLRGSCGGLAGLRDKDGNTLCDACAVPDGDCSGVDDGERRGSDDTVFKSPDDTITDRSVGHRPAR